MNDNTKAASQGALCEEPISLREALEELVELMQGVIDGDYTPDSFTLQPAQRALAQTEQAAPRMGAAVTDAGSDIAAARKILARLCDKGLVSMSIPVRQNDEDMILSRVIDRAALAASATPGSGEPVGYTSPGGIRRMQNREADSLEVNALPCAGCDVPVYTRPAASAGDALTDEQMDGVMRACQTWASNYAFVGDAAYPRGREQLRAALTQSASGADGGGK